MQRFRFVVGLHNILLWAGCVGILYALIFAAIAFVSIGDFTVLGSERVCEQPLNNRCVKQYKIKESGSSSIEAREFNMYRFRAEELAVGNRILKRPLSFSYLINGELKQWAYGSDLLTIWLLGVVVVAVWYRWTKALK